MPKFFDFFSKKEPEIRIKVEYNNLENWIKSQVAEDFRIIYEQGNSILEQTNQSCSIVKKSAEEFSRAEIKTGELNEHLIPTINNSRSSVVLKTINSICKLKFPKITDFSTLVSVSQSYSQTLAQIDQTIKTHGRVVFTILNKEIRPLMSELKVLQKQTAELSRLVEINSSKADRIQKLYSAINQLNDLRKDNKKLANNIIDDKINHKKLLKNKLEKERLLMKITDGEDYQKSIKKIEEQKDVSLQLIRLKAEFDTLFSKLRKPLEKYSYIAKINKNEKRILERYIESPSLGLISDENLILKKFLSEIVTSVKNRKVSIKNPEKVIFRIREILPKLKELRNNITSTSKYYEQNSIVLKNSSIKELEIIERDLSRKTKQIQELNSAINRKNDEIDSTRKKIRELVNELESEIKETLKKKIQILNIE